MGSVVAVWVCVGLLRPASGTGSIKNILKTQYFKNTPGINKQTKGFDWKFNFPFVACASNISYYRKPKSGSISTGGLNFDI